MTGRLRGRVTGSLGPSAELRVSLSLYCIVRRFTVGIIFCLCKLSLANCRPESEAIPIGRRSTSKEQQSFLFLRCNTRDNTAAKSVTLLQTSFDVDTATAFLSRTGDIMPALLPLSLPASSASQSVVELEQEEVRNAMSAAGGRHHYHTTASTSSPTPPPSLPHR